MYKLTDEDRQILKLGSTNANYITSMWLKNPSSGTWWDATTEDDEKRDGYWKLNALWNMAGKPSQVLRVETEQGDIDYKIKGPDTNGNPVFHHHHGFLLMPWQLQMHHAPEHRLIVIGGYGTGKTVGLAVSALVHAVQNREFAAAIIAPYSIQADEAWSKLDSLLRDTPFKAKFVAKMIRRPQPTIILQHDGIGQSSIRFLPILDDPGKLKTLELDLGYVDQAEMFTDLRRDIFEILGTRTRGQIGGRERMGRLGLFANSEDNPELWDAFDDAELDNDALGLQVATYDNPFITSSQVKRMEQDVGGDDESIRIHLRGGRPRGRGKHFPSSSLEACRSDKLDKYNLEGIAKDLPLFIRGEAARVGIHDWQIPPHFGAEHLVVADPGHDDPPNRNAAVIMAWDITDFPKKPASLRRFKWVYGGGSPDPFTHEFMDTVLRYKADRNPYLPDDPLTADYDLTPGWCALDSTGQQTLYDQYVFKEWGLIPDRLSMGGNTKYGALNAGKLLLSRGLMQFPYIPHIWLQHLKYDLPDNKLRQDIVMTMCMSAYWLFSRYQAELEGLIGERNVNSVIIRDGRNLRRSGTRGTNRRGVRGRTA